MPVSTVGEPGEYRILEEAVDDVAAFLIEVAARFDRYPYALVRDVEREIARLQAPK